MKIVKFLLALLATIALVHFMGKPLTIGKDTVPAVGPFFSPFSGFWQNAESYEGFESEKLEIPGIKGKVKIVFDDRLVPHIFAENMTDAIFAQGYVTARYRLWQMDMVSRLSAGRLSEVMGESLLENDMLQRRKGMLYGATKAEESWKKSPETYSLLEAYAAGANAWVENLPEAQRPLEFKLLGYAPEQWSPLKTALVKKYMDLTLCSAEEDLESTNSLKVLGPDLFQKLYPEWNPKQMPVVPAGMKWDFPASPVEASSAVQEAIGMMPYDVYEKSPKFIGSNNWAVSGGKTASGNPILCNDPHLRLSLPSIWFEVQIHTPEMNAYGVSVPGIPGILIGFNEHTAWGETNVGQDVVDWYKIDWTDGARTTYQLDGGLKEAELIVESYSVKGKEEPVNDTVRWTVWGPVVYGGKDNDWTDLAMRWVAHDAPDAKDLNTFLGLSQGKSLDDYSKALLHYDFPAQNFVFASQNGDIAITVNGKFPIKNKQQGRYVQDGSQSANAWSGFIPKSQVPRSVNPSRGFVASANQHSTAPDYPYYYNSSSFDDYRARYLVGRLNEMEKITVEDMQALQNSTYSLLAEEALTGLLGLLNADSLAGDEQTVLKKLVSWDFNYAGDKVEPAIFEVWWDNFYMQTFDEVFIYKDSLPMLMPENWRLVELLSKTPKDAIFDDQKTPGKETAKEIALASLKKTCTDMEAKFLDPSYDWATEKGTSIMHLARIPAFSILDMKIGGNKQALNALSKFHGPSWRMVVELGDEVKAWGVFPGGQSGNPGSRFYTTDIDKWSKGEYNQLFFMKNDLDDSQPALFTIEMN